MILGNISHKECLNAESPEQMHIQATMFTTFNKLEFQNKIQHWNWNACFKVLQYTYMTRHIKTFKNVSNDTYARNY